MSAGLTECACQVSSPRRKLASVMSSSARLQRLASGPALDANVVPRRSTAGLSSPDGTHDNPANPQRNTTRTLNGTNNRNTNRPPRQRHSRAKSRAVPGEHSPHREPRSTAVGGGPVSNLWSCASFSSTLLRLCAREDRAALSESCCGKGIRTGNRTNTNKRKDRPGGDAGGFVGSREPLPCAATLLGSDAPGFGNLSPSAT